MFKSNRKKAVSIDMEGTILDLATRKPVAPGPELLYVYQLIPQTENFEILPELRRLNLRNEDH